MTANTVVVDASIFVAIFRGEADAAQLTERAYSYKRRVTSAATWLEAAMVCEGARKAGGAAQFERIVASLGVEIVSLTPAHARLGLDAFKRFGKGRGAKASFNYGDCFVYALAKDLGAPVLFKGDDFALTDLQPA